MAACSSENGGGRQRSSPCGANARSHCHSPISCAGVRLPQSRPQTSPVFTKSEGLEEGNAGPKPCTTRQRPATARATARSLNSSPTKDKKKGSSRPSSGLHLPLDVRAGHELVLRGSEVLREWTVVEAPHKHRITAADLICNFNRDLHEFEPEPIAWNNPLSLQQLSTIKAVGSDDDNCEDAIAGGRTEHPRQRSHSLQLHGTFAHHGDMARPHLTASPHRAHSAGRDESQRVTDPRLEALRLLSGTAESVQRLSSPRSGSADAARAKLRHSRATPFSASTPASPRFTSDETLSVGAAFFRSSAGDESQRSGRSGADCAYMHAESRDLRRSSWPQTPRRAQTTRVRKSQQARVHWRKSDGEHSMRVGMWSEAGAAATAGAEMSATGSRACMRAARRPVDGFLCTTGPRHTTVSRQAYLKGRGEAFGFPAKPACSSLPAR
mmetsp:Transcript_24651/g.51608  ORF Transcript_24651/g.51608 Transcript_24651/m.51608 type:complete len:439 (-) Transcript_24651:541-1857(-)